MYKHILIPTDGSPLSDKAIAAGAALARAVNAKLTVLTVTIPFHIFSVDMVEYTQPRYEEQMKAFAARVLAKAAAAAKTAGVQCQTLHLEHEHPYRAIIDTAQSKGCDLILMASHGRRGVSALVLGSETVKVLTHSNLPVLVHR